MSACVSYITCIAQVTAHISRKIDQELNVKEAKPSIVNEQCVVYKYQCDLCDAGYIIMLIFGATSLKYCYLILSFVFTVLSFKKSLLILHIWI